ncbi:uncharacterized protein [Erythrolamprus reginae]|uniref:uncharacterized protein n=1 Tax=Erythrolamprus reginae TaxID=121349 RepID=UPI00396CD356
MQSLENLLRRGEYNMFQYSPIFESDFYQINKEGKPSNIHNKKKIFTLGVTTTNPTVPVPNTLLLATPIVSFEEEASSSILHQHLKGNLELKRLFPLSLVKISIHNLEMKQLRLKLVNGDTYYLQLYPASYHQQDCFDIWVRIVEMLRPPSKINCKQEVLENKKLEKVGVSLVPPLKPKSPLPQRESQCVPEKKTKNKKTICTVIQNPTPETKERKKKGPTALRSKSAPTPEIKPPPLKIENMHEASSQTPKGKNIAKKLEREKIKNPGGEKESLDINRYRKPVRKNLSRPSSQSRFGRRGAAAKPSKIASLFIGCFGSQRKNK